ncbi:pantetheine-phosphate adenylyltransferase [Limnochorda pilosa]|uniref:Phosphopantetheine adenylyltransferase n=1 Tax=Limnochorda pilosa TaxID=1555112 RepID=A0A0K2SKR8_LIMPI|nr:pantetheine-phosphate adenylyltransferase [Limnochorda pilosa]BAS27454.1 phosphopantetheine adenylyltransferase [Limnochorda pilosa]
MKVGVYPGSFDPVTYGHLDIVQRAADLFERLYVAVLKNPAKEAFFPVEERVEMLQAVTRHLPNVVCESFEGLVVRYAQERKATAIVRGLRAVSDFEIEFKMASMNRSLAPEMETIFMMTSAPYSFVSSSIIKEVASFGGSVGNWVPREVEERLARRLNRQGGREG